MSYVKSVIKGLKILEFIADSASPPTLVQITKALGMNRTTVYHLIQTLESEGYVTKERQSNAYLDDLFETAEIISHLMGFRVR